MKGFGSREMVFGFLAIGPDYIFHFGVGAVQWLRIHLLPHPCGNRPTVGDNLYDPHR